MKNSIKIFSVSLLMMGIFAQVLMAQVPRRKLAVSLTYEMSQNSGTNAAAVAWNPEKRVYYTVIAGNKSFPLEAFNAQGVTQYEGESGQDLRGMWYNPKSNTVQANGAGEMGWFEAEIDVTGAPQRWRKISSGKNQPDFQSVGAYDSKKKKVVFIDYSVDGLAFYSIKKPSKIKRLNLDLSSLDLGNTNGTTAGYTGQKGYEFVLLDFMSGSLHFFDRKGNPTAVSKFPGDAPMNDSFAFSFANGHAFLYDKSDRVWYGYRVF